MVDAGTTFCVHQVILAVDFIHMRTFNPDRLFFWMNAFVHNNLARAHHLVVLPVKLLNSDSTVSVIFSLEIGRLVVINHISLAIFIKEDARVNTSYFRDTNRVAPFAERILSLHIEVASTDIGRNHVVSLVVRIIADGRRKDTTADMLTYHVDQLGRTAQHMTHLLPVYQVTAMENRHTGEIGERRSHQKIIAFTVGTDARVRIPTRKDRRIETILALQRIFFIETVVTLISEIIKQSDRLPDFRSLSASSLHTT